jgi:hypothetical protein
VFAFDDAGVLRLVNRFGETLLAAPGAPARAQRGGARARAVSRAGDGADPRRELSGGSGRWEVRKSSFRQGGVPTSCSCSPTSAVRCARRATGLAAPDSRAGHELNNSLAPIQSIAGSLKRLAEEAEPPPDWREDLRRGLAVIASRAEALSRFTNAYAKLARLPPPRPVPVAVDPLMRRVTSLETRLPVGVIPGPPATLSADADQLEQLLINLVRNAADAALETRGGVAVGWKRTRGQLEIWVADDGPGLPNTSNLFVPFFTTKPEGSGIGLVLSRQIAEAHGGTLALENRRGHRGCIARLRLPEDAPLSPDLLAALRCEPTRKSGRKRRREDARHPRPCRSARDGGSRAPPSAAATSRR